MLTSILIDKKYMFISTYIDASSIVCNLCMRMNKHSIITCSLSVQISIITHYVHICTYINVYLKCYKMRTTELLIIPRFSHNKIHTKYMKRKVTEGESTRPGKTVFAPLASFCTTLHWARMPPAPAPRTTGREARLHVPLEAEKGGERVTYLSWWSSRSAVRNRWKYRVRKVGTRGAGRGEGGGGLTPHCVAKLSHTTSSTPPGRASSLCPETTFSQVVEALVQVVGRGASHALAT